MSVKFIKFPAMADGREFMEHLFDMGIPQMKISGGSCRAHSGTIMERVLMAMFNLIPGPANGSSSTCPDAYTSDGKENPVEMKSLRRGNKLVIYGWRVDKDLPNTLYFIGVHNRKKSEDVKEVWEGLSNHMECVMILTVAEIEKLAKAEPIKKIKSTFTKSGKRNGYQRKGYKEGYHNIPYKELVKACPIQLPFRVSCTLHKLTFSSPVFCSIKALSQ